jgi:hypothetical protein
MRINRMGKVARGVGVAVVIAVVAGMLWQQHRLTRVARTLAELQAQSETVIVSLEKENRALREQLLTSSQRTDSNVRELARLRGQYVRMRLLEEENASLQTERDQLAQALERGSSQSAVEDDSEVEPEPRVPPPDPTYGEGTADLLRAAKLCWLAVRIYTDLHDGLYPSTLEEAVDFVTTELPPEERAQQLTWSERFDLVYHGNPTELADLPAASTIMLIERRPWLTISGEWAKVYATAGGSAFLKTMATWDGLLSWEGGQIKPYRQ